MIVNFLKKHQNSILIVLGITTLNFAYGFDARFTIINLLWIFTSLNTSQK